MGSRTKYRTTFELALAEARKLLKGLRSPAKGHRPARGVLILTGKQHQRYRTNIKCRKVKP